MALFVFEFVDFIERIFVGSDMAGARTLPDSGMDIYKCFRIALAEYPVERVTAVQ